MPLHILNLPRQFRPKTSIVYPPFKNGMYMEEYFYDYISNNIDMINDTHTTELAINALYIPIFWTNLQNHPGFKRMRENLSLILNEALQMFKQAHPNITTYFTVVQHDDGPLLPLPPKTEIFGACTGTIPLPLIYEDNNNTLTNIAPRPSNSDKSYLASFVGSNTHKVRRQMSETLKNHEDIYFSVQNIWTNTISENLSDLFISKTLDSKFCLCPRGYGRSSFRFFESMLLGIPPVYFWDDIEWLPYKEYINYDNLSLSIHVSQIDTAYLALTSITHHKYQNLLDNITHHAKWFTMEGMTRYILSKVSTNTPHPWSINLPQQ